MYTIIYQKMIKMLSNYILQNNNNNNNQNWDADDLIKQNQQIKNRITELQNKLDQVVFNKHDHLVGLDKLTQVLQILKMSDQELQIQKQQLSQQREYIENLMQYVKKYIAEQGTQPRVLQKKLKILTELTDQAEQNSYPQPQLDKMKSWTKKLLKNLQKKLCDLVSVFPNRIRIRLSDIKKYKDLLNEQICRQLIRGLYRDTLEYHVPTSEYILIAPKEQKQIDGTIQVQREKVIFPGQKSQANYQSIQSTIKQNQRLALQISNMFQKQSSLYAIIMDEIKVSKQNIQAQVQYIFPYLSLDKRKKIIDLLATKAQNQANLYDILARLRIKGQDGDMMQANICLLIDKVKANPAIMSEVLTFLQICQSEDKSLNIGFYMCNQLLSRLEDVVDYKQIQKLLSLREQMRFRIHHPG